MPCARPACLLKREYRQPVSDHSFYVGWYSNRARGERAKKASPQAGVALPSPGEEPANEFVARARAAWARLIRKVYEADPLECPKCQGPMRVMALIEDPQVIRRILEHLGLWAPLATEQSPPLGPASWPRHVSLPLTYQFPTSPDLPYGKDPLETAGLRERACFALVLGIDCSVTDQQSRSRPARIAVISLRGRSKREPKTHYARSDTSSTPAPGAPARRPGIAAGLNFLSFMSLAFFAAAVGYARLSRPNAQ